MLELVRGETLLKICILLVGLLISSNAYSMYDDDFLRSFLNGKEHCSPDGFVFGANAFDNQNSYLKKSKYLNRKKVKAKKFHKECISLAKNAVGVLLEKDECNARWVIYPKDKKNVGLEFLFSGIHYPPNIDSIFTNFLDVEKLRKSFKGEKWDSLEKSRKKINKDAKFLSLEDVDKLSKAYAEKFEKLKSQYIAEKKIDIEKIEFLSLGYAGCH